MEWNKTIHGINSLDKTDCENRTLPEWQIWQKTVVSLPLALIMLFIVLGNLLVIVAILSQKNLRTPSNIYILSLAMTDLSVGVFILPFNVKDMIHGWMLGTVLCRIWLTADVTLCSSSILHILAIAVDRFRSINEGLNYAQSKTKKSSVLICLGLWFLAFWIASPPVLGWNDWERNCPHDCFLTKELGYQIHSAAGAFFIPAFVMVGLYLRIFVLLRRKFRARATIKCIQEPQSSHDLDQSSDTGNSMERTLDSRSITATNTSPEDTLTTTDNFDAEKMNEDEKLNTLKKQKLNQRKRKPSEQISAIIKNKQKFSLTKERKATMTLGILIGAFLISWTPFTLYYLTTGIVEGAYDMTIFQIVTWLGYLNSAVNPIIYTKYNPEFRRVFRKIICAWKHN